MWTITRLTTRYLRSLAECHIECWREAYRGIVPDHVLDAFDIDRRADAWERTAGKSAYTIHVALHGEEVVGFAAVGPDDAPDPPTTLALHALYIRGAYYGSGLADALITSVLEPTTPCSLWVFEANPRARVFYRRHGFTPDGARKPEPWSPGAIAIRMLRSGNVSA